MTFGPRGTASRRALGGSCHGSAIRLGRTCHTLPATFADGHLTTSKGGKVTFIVRPGGLARAALADAAGPARGILVGAQLKVQSAVGGDPSSQARALADYLIPARRS